MIKYTVQLESTQELNETAKLLRQMSHDASALGRESPVWKKRGERLANLAAALEKAEKVAK